MQIRKFVGISIPEAMAQVKCELGSEAVIMETRKFRPGDRRTRLFTRPLFEVTAAIDYDAPTGLVTGQNAYAAVAAQAEHAQSEAASASTAAASLPQARAMKREPENDAPLMLGSAAQLEEQRLAPLRDEIGSLRREAETVIRVLDLTPEQANLAEELKEIRRLLLQNSSAGRQVGTAAGSTTITTADIPEPGCSMIQTLLGQGVEEELIEQLLSDVRRSLRQEAKLLEESAELNGAKQPLDISELIRTSLGESFSCARPAAATDEVDEASAEREQIVCALVGPTGVGKTTTLAKLAARAAMQGQSVGLITLDTYRVAAAEQIQTYAKIMRIPVEVANNEAELRSALGKMSDKDCVFIDTAGHSHKHGDRLRRQAEILATCQARVSLVLSLTSRCTVLREVVDAYQDTGFHDVVFTKLDEADIFGNVINIGAYCQKSVTFLTNGQRVPEDIVEAKSSKIIDLCLGSEMASLD